MRTSRSVDEILANLEEQVAFHAERESFHAAEEEKHREQRTAHAAALDEARRRLEAFRTATTEAVELAERQAPLRRPVPPVLADEDLGSPSRPRVGRLAWLLIQARGPGESFGSEELCAEINERFRDRLRQPVDPRQMSVVLRRLDRRGLIHLVRPGRPYNEALYSRTER